MPLYNTLTGLMGLKLFAEMQSLGNLLQNHTFFCGAVFDPCTPVIQVKRYLKKPEG